MFMNKLLCYCLMLLLYFIMKINEKRPDQIKKIHLFKINHYRKRFLKTTQAKQHFFID